MEPTFEVYNLIWPVVSVGLIVPLVNWIKNKLPADFPIAPVFISALFSFGTVYLMEYVLKTGMTLQDMVTLALGVQFGGQTVHAVMKTNKTYQERQKSSFSNS